MTKMRQQNYRESVATRLKLVVLIVACAAFGYGFTVFPKNTLDEKPSTENLVPIVSNSAQNFSKFQHSNPMHSRMPCLLCHVRTEGSTTPKLPGHTSCAACHVQEFAGNTSQMCTICHTDTSVKPFPPLRSFNIKFDHSRHTRQTNCATCHRPSRRGVAFSMPSGANAHVTCFQCHGPRTEVAGRNIGSCSECHQPGRPVKGSEWAKAFTVNFSHQEHTRQGKMNCAACHTIRPGAARGKQVSSPAASMHFAGAGSVSCGGCHNDKRAFGPADFTNCKRCHEGKTFKF
ncbi:MAG: hypothetical protein IPL32_02905 [Chloracidobacterium sp.]|nr:hypothetical protein [Chloracidobacterium sp.]